MNLPIQKKPKLSFEAALFGEHPNASSKRNNLIPEKLEKVAIKKAARKVGLQIFLVLSIVQKYQDRCFCPFDGFPTLLI